MAGAGIDHHLLKLYAGQTLMILQSNGGCVCWFQSSTIEGLNKLSRSFRRHERLYLLKVAAFGVFLDHDHVLFGWIRFELCW